MEQMLYISPKEAWEFLEPRHYAGRKPVISRAFGCFIDDELVAVCTFGKPASNSLCEGVCGKENSKCVYELNWLCRIETLKEPLSKFVSWCLRQLKKENWIIVSYSDTGMHHNGYIYQACNFIYTGKTKERTDKYAGDGKHSRHYDNESKCRVVRTSKNRYIFFCTHSKHQKRKWQRQLQYPILKYPKEKNENYILGEYMQQVIVKE